MGRDLERAFDRFRRKGDTKALARVFDRTGRDLLALAQHLVSDVSDAEDLVQSTFVTAIDRAQSYDSTQPLRPWLTGILARHAANWNRRAQTRKWHTDAAAAEHEPERSNPWSPLQQACQAELEGSVEAAIQRLPARDQRVLQPYLMGTQRPEQIARALGEAPGTVRTQIHRGLERLRRILPAGALVGLVGTTRGMGAVRSSILQHAQISSGGAVLAAGAASPLILGGVIVAQKTIIAGGLAAAATLAWFVLPEGEEVQSPPMVQNQAAVVEETRVESNGSLAPLLPYAQAPNASELELEQTQAGSNVASDSKTRTVVKDGKAILRGRISGVLPEHFEDLEFSLKQNSSSDMRVINLLAGGSGGNEQATDSLPSERIQYMQAAREYSRSDFEASLTTPFTPHGGFIQISRWQQDLQDVLIQEDGSFEVDLTHLQHISDESFVLQASHDLYFEAEREFSFGAGLSARLEAGDRCEAKCDLTLEPAAIVAGKVERQGEMAMMVSWIAPGTEEAPSPPEESPAPDEELRPKAKQNTPLLSAALQRIGSELDREESHLLDLSTVYFRAHDTGSGVAFLSHSEVRVGLFRFGELEPIAEGTCDFVGEFRLRAREEGHFLLVAMQDDYPIFCQEVEIRFREVNQLEEPLNIAPNTELKGQVNDFGLLPEGGLGVRAERVTAKGAHMFYWGHPNQLVWEGREVYRTSSTTQTEAGGQFEFEGLSAGNYRVHIHHPEMQHFFSVGALEEFSCEVRTPTNQAFLSLPASVIEIRHEPRVSPGGESVEYEASTWVLEVQDASQPIEEARSRGQFMLHEDETQPLLLLPDANVRIVWIQNHGDPTQPEVKRELWVGQAGPMGSWDAIEVRLPFE